MILRYQLSFSQLFWQSMEKLFFWREEIFLSQEISKISEFLWQEYKSQEVYFLRNKILFLWHKVFFVLLVTANLFPVTGNLLPFTGNLFPVKGNLFLVTGNLSPVTGITKNTLCYRKNISGLRRYTSCNLLNNLNPCLF